MTFQQIRLRSIQLDSFTSMQIGGEIRLATPLRPLNNCNAEKSRKWSVRSRFSSKQVNFIGNGQVKERQTGSDERS